MTFLLNTDDNEIPKSFLGLMQIYPNKTAAFVKPNALVAYLVIVACFNLNAQQGRYLIDYGHILLGFLPVKSEEMKIEAEDARLEKDVFRHGFRSLELGPLETIMRHTSSSII